MYAVGAFVIQFFVPHDMQQVYIYESAPAEKRAKIYSVIKAIVTLALMMIPVLRNAFLHDNDLSQWRMVYIVPSFIALGIAVFALIFIRESDAFIDTRLRQLKMTDEEKAEARAKKQDQESKGGLIKALKFCFTHKQIRWMFIAGGFISFGMLVTQYYEVILTFGYAQQFAEAGMAMDAARAEAVEDLFYQYVQLLEEQGETDHKSVFIDGTKLESRAGRYTFTWRGTAEKNLEKTKKRVLEQTGCKSAEELEALVSQKGEGITFVHGKGKHKTDAKENGNL